MGIATKLEFLVYGQTVDPVSKYHYDKLREKMLKKVNK